MLTSPGYGQILREVTRELQLTEQPSLTGTEQLGLLEAFDREQQAWRSRGEFAIRVEMERRLARRLAC